MQTNTAPPARREEPEQEQTSPVAKRDWLSSLRSWFKRKEKPFDSEKALDRLAKLHSDLTDPWFNWQWKLAYLFRKRLMRWLFVSHWWTLFLALGLIVCGWFLASRTEQYHSRNLGELIQMVLFLLVWGATSLVLALVLRELLLRSPYLLELKISDPKLDIDGLSQEGFAVRFQHRLDSMILWAKSYAVAAGRTEFPIMAADGTGIEFEVAGRTQNLRHLTDSFRRLLGWEGRRILLTLHPQNGKIMASLTKPGQWTECVEPTTLGTETPEWRPLIENTLQALLSRTEPLLLYRWWDRADAILKVQKSAAHILARRLIDSTCSRNRADGWLILVYLAQSDNDWHRVIEYANKSLELRPYNVEALFAQGRAYIQLANTYNEIIFEKVFYTELSIRANAEVLKRTGLTQAAAWYNWAIALDSLGRHSAALRMHGLASLYAPYRSDVWNNWGSSLQLLGKYEEALVKFRRASELAPSDSRMLFNWGNMLLMVGKKTEALEKFKQARRFAEPAGEKQVLSSSNDMILKLESELNDGAR